MSQGQGKTLRGACIGFGYISERGHLPAYASKKNFRIVALADTCEARRQVARRALPEARIYPDADSLIEAEATRIDFVDIATPPCDHASIAHKALSAGLHVFCEKPLTTTAHDARALLDHAVAAKRVLFPSHTYKHAPVIRAVRNVLDSGRLGPIHLVTLDTFRTTHARGVSEWLPDWRRSHRYSGGGIAMDHGSHTFYLAFDWLGSYPTAITAKMLHFAGHDTEDGYSCTATFPTGTAVAQLTWNAGVRKVIYTIHGERGAITVEDDDLSVVLRGAGTASPAVEKSSVSSNWIDAAHSPWFASLFDEFARAIERQEYVGKEAREASLCVELIETSYASAKNGCRELPLGAAAHNLAVAAG